MLKNKNILIQVGIILPIFFFTLMLFTYSVNVPWFDDVDAFPDFLGRFLEAKDNNERIWLVFKPNNEHRIVYSKLVTLLHFYISGTLNIRTLIILSNITLLGTLLIFWQVIKAQKLPMLCFLPIPLLLLQPQYYLTSTWVISGFQNQPVIFFGLLGIYCLSKNTVGAFWAGVFVIFFNSFTMSSGLFYWVAGIAVLALQGRYKWMIVWLASMFFTFKLYFYQFDTQANSEGFQYFFKHPHESFFGFFTHLGGSLDFMTLSPILIRSVIPTISGFVLIGVAISWIFQSVYKSKSTFSIPVLWANLQARFNNEPSNYIILGGFLFLATNAFVLAILRPRFGYAVMIVGNYKIYTSVFLVISYLMLLTGWLKYPNNHKYFKWLVFGCVIFNVASYIKFLPEVHERRKDLLVRAFNQTHNQIGLGPQVGSDFDKYVQTALGRLVPKKIYQFPETIFTRSEKEIFQKLSGKPFLKVDIAKINDETVISNSTLPIGLGLNDGVYVLFKSAKRNYIFYENSNLQSFFKTGFTAKVPVHYFIPDTYQIGIFWVNGATHKIFNTNQSIDVNN